MRLDKIPATTLSHQSSFFFFFNSPWLRGSFACVFRVIASPPPSVSQAVAGAATGGW